MKLYRILLVAALGALALAACKKEEETTTSKSLVGTLTAGSMDAYSNPGDTYHFEASGLSLAADETDKSLKIVYYFTVEGVSDSTNAITVVIPDTLGTYSLTVSAKAEGYYTRTATISTTVVSSRSLTNMDKLIGTTVITDPRDSRKYMTINAGGKDWFVQNLSYYEKDTDGNYTLGRPYKDSRAVEEIIGGFYTWTDAQNACPAGWRMPTSAEFDALGTDAGALMCNAYFNGARLWEFWPNVNISNTTGFCALPFGYATIVDDEYTFYGFNDYCYYWVDNGGSPMCRAIYVKDSGIISWGSPSPTDFAAQLRCVKE